MTKVYLVVAEYRYKSNEEWNYGNPRQIEVFTNRKLAKAYAEYWNLKSKRWKKELGEWRFKIQDHHINSIDYRDDVLKEQIKELPY